MKKKFTASFFAEEIAEIMREAPGGRYGQGDFPRKDGGLQGSVTVLYKGDRTATIAIGGESAPYAKYVQFYAELSNGKDNPNYMFMEKRTLPYVKKIMEGRKY